MSDSHPLPIDIALSYATAGKPVFPVSPGSPYSQKAKTPLTRRGFKDATTDVEQIKRWWTDNPTACIAYPTGEPSGIICIDVDRHDGGTDGFAELEALAVQGFRLPAEMTVVETPSNGWHILFRAPPGKVKSRKLSPAIDLKADGGYIVAAGSILSDGRSYRVIRRPA